MILVKRIATLLGAAALVGLSGAAVAAPEPSPPVGIRLPQARLVLVAGNASGATFLEPDSIVWTGRTAVVMTYSIFEPPAVLSKGKIVVQGVNRLRFDCTANTRQNLGSEGYDEAGKSLVWLPEEPAEPIAPNSSHYFVAKVVCEKVGLPASNIVQGYVAARALALRMLAQ